jgi:hypothetical protein
MRELDVDRRLGSHDLVTELVRDLGEGANACA